VPLAFFGMWRISAIVRSPAVVIGGTGARCSLPEAGAGAVDDHSGLYALPVDREAASGGRVSGGSRSQEMGKAFRF